MESTNNYFISIRTKAYKVNLVTVHFLTSVSDKFQRSVTVRDRRQKSFWKLHL